MCGTIGYWEDAMINAEADRDIAAMLTEKDIAQTEKILTKSD